MKEVCLSIAGAAGRMGQRLIRKISETPGFRLNGALVSARSPYLGKDAGEKVGVASLGVPFTDDPLVAFKEADGVLDFSTPDSAVDLCSVAARLGIFDVIGVSGCTQEQEDKICSESSQIAILRAHNMSPAMNVLSFLVEQTSRILQSQDFDIEILEMHHKHKVDSPSGSAVMLAQSVARGRSIALDQNQIRVRDGMIGSRPAGAIGFAVLRGGSVPGDHSVIFAGEKERLVLSHYAQDPELFAVGALHAALWVSQKGAGFYSMRDVLGFS